MLAAGSGGRAAGGRGRTCGAGAVLEGAAERVRAGERHNLLVVEAHAAEDGAQVGAGRVVLREGGVARRQARRVTYLVLGAVLAAVLHVDLGAARHLHDARATIAHGAGTYGSRSPWQQWAAVQGHTSIAVAEPSWNRSAHVTSGWSFLIFFTRVMAVLRPALGPAVISPSYWMVPLAPPSCVSLLYVPESCHAERERARVQAGLVVCGADYRWQLSRPSQTAIIRSNRSKTPAVKLLADAAAVATANVADVQRMSGQSAAMQQTVQCVARRLQHAGAQLQVQLCAGCAAELPAGRGCRPPTTQASPCGTASSEPSARLVAGTVALRMQVCGGFAPSRTRMGAQLDLFTSSSSLPLAALSWSTFTARALTRPRRVAGARRTLTLRPVLAV